MPPQYSPSGGKFPIRYIHFRTPAVGLSATTNPVPVLFPPLFVRGPRANSLSRFVWKKKQSTPLSFRVTGLVVALRDHRRTGDAGQYNGYNSLP
jgi:hypothetical protein